MFYPPMIGYLVVSAVCVVLVMYQRRKPIARNTAIGIRTRYTLMSEAAWQAGQRAGSPYLIAMALIGLSHAAARFGAEPASATRRAHVASVRAWPPIITCDVLAVQAATPAATTAAPWNSLIRRRRVPAGRTAPRRHRAAMALPSGGVTAGRPQPCE